MPTRNNIRRFGLHILFGVGAAVATAIGADIASLNLSPQVAGVIVLLATSAASFFRKQGEAND